MHKICFGVYLYIVVTGLFSATVEASEDCDLVGLLAETVMQSRQYQLYKTFNGKTQLQKDMITSAYGWPGFFDERRKDAAIRQFKREWVDACERGIYRNR